MKTKKLTAEAEKAICSGAYGASGQRFPSVRQYMQETGVSYKTAYRIFKLLEEKGCTDGHTVHIYDFEFDFVK